MKPNSVKKRNPYAARIVLRRRKTALSRGKRVNSLAISRHGDCLLPRQRHCRASSVPPRPRHCHALLQNKGNYWKSAVPMRIMFFCDENWTNFPAEATEAVKTAFGSGNLSVVVKIDGSLYLVDFLRMLQFDLATGSERSIAWIDVKGKCFFPETFINRENTGRNSSSPIKLEIELKIARDSNGDGKIEAHLVNAAREGGTVVKVVQIGCVNRRGGSGNGAKLQERENGADGALNGNGNARGNFGNPGNSLQGKNNGEDKLVMSRERRGDSGNAANRRIVPHLPDLNEVEVVERDLRDTERKRIAKSPSLKENGPDNGNSGNRVQDNVVSANIGANRTMVKHTLDRVEKDGDDMSDAKRVCSSNLPESRKSSDKSVVSLNKGKQNFDLKGMELVEAMEGQAAYNFVKNLLLAGMGKIKSSTVVNSIYWCSHASEMGRVRRTAFRNSVEKVKAARGGANVKRAWYRASPKVIESIVIHGFGQVETQSASEAYGIGIHLYAEGHSQASVSKLRPADGGQFHVVLCRVIVGNTEQVKLGSCQLQPSSEDFDSGVDDLTVPRLHIIWSAHMNTHILPEYIVSFSVSNHLGGVAEGPSQSSSERTRMIQGKTSRSHRKTNHCSNEKMPSAT